MTKMIKIMLMILGVAIFWGCEDSSLPTGPMARLKAGGIGLAGGSGMDIPQIGNRQYWPMHYDQTEVYIPQDQGGSLVFKRGRLDVLPNSIGESSTIWVQTRFLSGNILKNIYEFGPTGTTFDPPATLVLTYCNMHSFDQDTLTLSYFNEETGRWEIVTTMTHDPSTRSFYGPITHFSRYSLSANGQILQQPVEER